MVLRGATNPVNTSYKDAFELWGMLPHFGTKAIHRAILGFGRLTEATTRIESLGLLILYLGKDRVWCSLTPLMLAARSLMLQWQGSV